MPIEFQPSFIFQVEMTLTSPGGQSVDLIGTSFIPPLGSFTGGALWDIAFLPCAEPVVPDIGFPPIWNNDEAWSLGGQYTGSYYPHMGCLEDFNTGVVDGTWTLTVTNDNGFYTGNILDFEIIFCDTTGMGCFSCVADAGDLSAVAAVEACEGDSTNLSLNITPTYTGSPPDTLEYSYTWVVSQGGTVLAYDTIPNLSAYEDGTYQVCGLSYLTNDSLLLPEIDGTLTLDELALDFAGLSPSFCGDLSDTCVTVVILSNSSTIVDTICAGDSYAYDGQSLDTTGVYTFVFPSAIGCIDSTVTIDLLVLDSIFTQVQDTICFGDSSSIGGQYFSTSGIHYATVPALQVNCDSIIELDLVVLDTSITMLVDSICIGDTLWVGATPFDTTGNYSVTLTNLLGCDSLVELQLSLIDTAINNIQVAICNGAMYAAGGMDYDQTGMYQINLPSTISCDSLINLDLTVLNPQVSIDLPDTIDCNLTSFNLNGTVTATNTNTVISFQWTHLDNGSDGIIADANTLQPLINKSGMYQLEVTETYLGVDCVNSVVVEVISDEAIPDINITPVSDITCVDSVVMLSANSTASPLSYLWAGPLGFSSTQADTSTNIEGTYYIEVTASNGCNNIDSINIGIDTLSPPLTLLVNDTLDCVTDSVQLQSMSSAGGLTYAWSSPGGFSSTAANPYTQVADEYTLIVTAPNGCSAIGMVVVEADESTPDLSLSTDTLTCEIDSVQLQSMSSVTGLTYAWSSPGGFSSTAANPYTQVADTYTLIVTAPNGCTAMDTVVVEADETTPDLSLSADTLTCEKDSVQLQSMSSVTGLTYAWSSPGGFTSTVANPYTQIADEYTLIITTPGGCSATENITVTQDTISPDLSLDGGTISCAVSEVQLMAFSSVDDLDYSWSGPGSFTSDVLNPMVTLTGFYTLEVSAPNGCTTSQSIEVIGDLTPPQSVITDTNGEPLDCINLSVLLSGENSNPQNNVLYQWWDQSTLLSMSEQLEVTTGGTYQLIVEDISNGCLDTSQITIGQDIAMPVAVIEQTDSISCESSSITIDASNSSSGIDFEYLWSTSGGNIVSGENSLTPEVDASGEYVLTITDTENGCTATETVSVSNTANDILIGYIDWVQPTCFGENDGLLLIDSVSGGTAPYVFSFDESDFTTLSIFGNLGAGTYPLQIEDAAGCVFDTLFTLNQPSPIQVDLGEDQTVQLGDSVEFEAQIFLSTSELDTFIWSNTSLLNCDTCLEQNLTPLETISFTITAYDENGCSDSDDILIKVVKDRLVYVPNAFSPNDDGQNDVFMINAGMGVERINTLRIFDRFGELLFKADDFDPNDRSYSWDGTLKGEPLNPQVVVYYFKVTYTDGWSEVVKGDITILK